MFNFSIQRIDDEREEEKNQSAVSNTPHPPSSYCHLWLFSKLGLDVAQGQKYGSTQWVSNSLLGRNCSSETSLPTITPCQGAQKWFSKHSLNMAHGWKFGAPSKNTNCYTIVTD